MATNNYILTIKGDTDAQFVVSYKSGKFFRLEQKRGKLTNVQRDKLMTIVPEQEASTEQLNKKFDGRVVYVRVKKNKSLFAQFMDVYFDFYDTNNGIPPRINAIEGKSLNHIIKHFKTLCVDDADSLETWKALLSNWSRVESFYAKQMELRQINSNINTIILQVKNGKQTNKERNKANGYADDIRQGF